ncbi:outer membrane protein 11 [Chlamydia pneumoniae TW-183]|uniref:Outer membrane protein 11 n=2 Tax=Chlamydia pneumoniae TaxID=83558 RepID=A0A0F7X457_CHLPN|nr:hypothetical protein [Chlamydia pneumoniae]AAP97955.1 outer membrane protein 11 [Chlamydia pneumoniae TW-183]CRI32514.1 Outer membrane protein 11 [Chlamydia pneumoniae]CRI35374.1 Outer membrane protein 11 [Chlamydia pneumoniae]CRI36501.1 Outer membrane protein 11 [Chlamydia pneumoniae]CRI37625.1 Outer membrane protein 11 [Chlamydia pneumoniae]
MKTSVSMLLALLCSGASSIVLHAATTPLNPEDGFIGEGNTNTFSPKSTTDAAGTTYSLTGEVLYIDPGKGGSITGTCFVETAGDLTFLGNGNTLKFLSVDAGANIAVAHVQGSKNLSFTDFLSLVITESPKSAVTTGKGSLVSLGAVQLQDINTLVLTSNASVEDGGVIKGNSCLIQGIKNSAIFGQNTSSKKGGAISTTQGLTIENNLGTLKFNENKAVTSGGALDLGAASTFTANHELIFSQNKTSGNAANGGAINCSGDLTFTDNTSLLLQENSTMQDGGALCSTGTISITGSDSINVIGNTSGQKGGAISAASLKILGGQGGALFSNNVVTHATPLGGAIFINTGGSLQLFTQGGDIVFEGNQVTTTAPNATTKRNVIHLESTAKWTGLAASQGNAIYFYDPITTNDTGASDNLRINEVSANQKLSGSIVFSGERLSTAEAIAENLTSRINQPVTLVEGSLVLKQGVTLITQGFSQEPESTLLLDLGTSL